jgi:hypothetical protein
MCGKIKSFMKEVLWDKSLKRFKAYAQELYNKNKKLVETILPALYDSVGRVIPCRVARQHCPTPFHHDS